ncbi:MAG: GNAT family N-acetyltransferase [Flavobacterium sp.]
MKQYQVKRYQQQHFTLWNAFISVAKNATFLFHRDFMEYHSDRFNDYSLLILDQDKLVAVLPANRLGDTVYSHQGLSYGSLVVKKDIRIKEYVLLFKEIMQFLQTDGVEYFELKLLPKIYNQTIADEIDYVAFLMQSSLYRTDVYLTIDMQIAYQPNRNRKRALKIANELGIDIKEEENFDGFWNQILIPNLQERFGVTPVHSCEEIKMLATLFPNNILLFNAFQNNCLKAGVVMFLTDNVAHFQYSSGGNDRNDTAALDVLFDFIIQKYADKKYVSFGSSSEDNGLKLNEGLAYWKESFGAKTAVQSFHRFKTSNHYLLDTILL